MMYGGPHTNERHAIDMIMRLMFRQFLLLVLLLPSCAASAADLTASPAALGEALFFDTGLSANRSQSCASCHNPATAFADGRDNGVAGAASLGGDGKSLGDRNAPGLTYAARVPEFHRMADGEYKGGAFHDGRAANLTEQAAQPLVNPAEMAMPDAAAVVRRVAENPRYVAALQQHFGADVMADDATAFRSIVESIVAFERSETFAPFDSRYDRFLRGEIELDAREELGRKLFYSQLFNCHSCHLEEAREFHSLEMFTTHRYHNIGVPVNAGLRERNGLGAGHRDLGLLDNPRVNDAAQAGRFRVPTLRNVAVTAPYMHNGVFADLETVVLFYNKFTLSNTESQTNPETGRPWGRPEVEDTVDLAMLAEGQPISPLQVQALVAFLEALTDRRYEHLLERQEYFSTISAQHAVVD